MSRKYSISGSDTNTASTTQLGLTSTAAIQPVVGFLSVGSVATPADNAWEFFLQRYTAAGTSTALTPQALNPSDPAATATAGINHSVEPTYTANAILLRIAGNMRTPFVFYAMPGWGLKLPSTAANGLGLLSNAIGGSAVAMSYTIHYEE
jgi:hypothetical protein